MENNLEYNILAKYVKDDHSLIEAWDELNRRLMNTNTPLKIPYLINFLVELGRERTQKQTKILSRSLRFWLYSKEAIQEMTSPIFFEDPGMLQKIEEMFRLEVRIYEPLISQAQKVVAKANLRMVKKPRKLFKCFQQEDINETNTQQDNYSNVQADEGWIAKLERDIGINPQNQRYEGQQGQLSEIYSNNINTQQNNKGNLPTTVGAFQDQKNEEEEKMPDKQEDETILWKS